MEAATMSSLLTDLMTVVTQAFSVIGTICTTITSQPLLLMTVGFLFIYGRLYWHFRTSPQSQLVYERTGAGISAPDIYYVQLS